MDITLSWDLFIAFFFAVVVAYSFIIGKHKTLTILIAVYIAILATQGIGNIITIIAGESDPMYRILKVIGIELNVSTLSIGKLVIFMIMIIAIALKGSFSVEYSDETSSAISILATGLFGFATAGIIVTTLLTFVAGAPLLDQTLSTKEIIIPLMTNSRFAQIMVLNQNLWFSLPALLLIGFGILREKLEE